MAPQRDLVRDEGAVKKAKGRPSSEATSICVSGGEWEHVGWIMHYDTGSNQNHQPTLGQNRQGYVVIVERGMLTSLVSYQFQGFDRYC